MEIHCGLPNGPHPESRSARRSFCPRPGRCRWHGNTATRAGARPCYGFCRRDYGTGQPALYLLRHAMPPEAVRHCPELLGSCQSPCLCFFVHRSETRAPSLHRHYPASTVLRTPPTSPPALPCPRGRHVVRRRTPGGISGVATELLCQHAATNAPVDLDIACFVRFMPNGSLPHV
jgi:hypothetical protein